MHKLKLKIELSNFWSCGALYYSAESSCGEKITLYVVGTFSWLWEYVTCKRCLSQRKER
jgi:hypothetical protein